VSWQGSSSSDAAVRVEVFLDDRPEAVQVLTAPPFRFQLDTSALAEGDHTLRLVRVDAAGRRRERTVPFTVEHGPGIAVLGLEAGATVSGRVDVDVVTPASAPPSPAPVRGPATWLYVLLTVLILGGIWVFFMVVPIYSSLVPAPSEAAAGSSQAAGPPVDQTLLKAGGQLYTSDCASCHKPTGEGMPPTFPALAGNSFLSDAAATVKLIYEGSGAMPSHPTYTTTQLAAVATYVRNTWGNSYGGVSVADAAAAAPKASSGGGASSGGASSSGTSTPAPSAPAPSTPSSSSAAATAGTSDAMQAGQKLYTADCAGCHQPNGAGMPPTFPALAGNNFLSDPAAVVQRIFEGKGTMPSHPSYTAKELADVATYIRNSWGNAFGPVSTDQAAQAAPKAAP